MNKPITLCDRCDIAASCLLNYDGVPCRKNRTVEPTNADRIRAMTDEELAEWIYKVQDEDALRKGNFLPPLSKSWWLDWMRKEVKCENS